MSSSDTTTLYVGAIILIVIVLTIMAFRNYISTKQQHENLNFEISQIREKVETVKANQTLVHEDINTYNKILASVVPESEDYFSIIVALEKLSQLTNFQIVRYNIILANTNPEKLSLLIEGDGDASSFLRFLREYRYAGGRLITNEKLEFANTSVGRIKLNVNFYHKAARSFGDKVGVISRRDVNLVKEIQQKVSLTFAQPGEEEIVNTEYEIATDPF